MVSLLSRFKPSGHSSQGATLSKVISFADSCFQRSIVSSAAPWAGAL